MDSIVPSADPPEITFTALWDYRLTRSFWIASFVVLLYEHLLTFDDEVTFMWTGKWSRARVLFFLNRYWPIVNLMIGVIIINLDHPSHEVCTFSYSWFIFSELFSQCSITTVLILRLYAIYNCDKKLLAILLAFQVIVLAIQVILSCILSSHMILVPISDGLGCIPGHWILNPWVYWTPGVIFETSLFLVVTWRSIRLVVNQEEHNPELLMVLMRDSLVYFAALWAIMNANLVIWAIGRQTIFIALPETISVLHSVIGCRMLLNIKKSVEPWRAEPWRDQDAAVFSAAIRPMQFFQNITWHSLRSNRNK